MAITEADYLLLQDLNKAQVWMLLGSEEQFHLVRVDASLTEQKYERLMKRYPCGMKTFQELGISATPLNRENCTHVILEGTEAGVKLTMYCAGTVRRFRLGDNYDEERLISFFNREQVQWRIEPEPEGPDAQTTKTLGWSLTMSGVALILLTAFSRQYLSKFRAVLGLLIFGAAVILCFRFPGRFAIGAMKNEDRSTKAKYRFDMELALGAPLMAMALDALRVTYTNLLALFLWGGLLGFGIGVLLIWVSRGHRSILVGALGLTLALMFFSCGILAQVNQLLDFSPVTVYRLTVDTTQIERGSRGGTSYECVVTMPDGEQLELGISRSQYESVNPGDPVTIVVHEGALGLEYLTIEWEK